MNLPFLKKRVYLCWSLLVRCFSLALLLTIVAGCNLSIEPEIIPEVVEGKALPSNGVGSFGYTPEGFLFAGAADAPVTVYEVFNANCPGCALHHTETLAKLVAEYGDSGEVKFVLVDLPLSRDWGEDAHFTAYCIGEQGSAKEQWNYWVGFYHNLERWYREGPTFTTELAREAGVNLAVLEDCLNNEARAQVYAMQAYAEEHILTARWSTPFFRLEDKRGRRLNTLTGSPPLAGWQRELDRYLG